MEVPKIHPSIKSQVDKILPSRDLNMEYRPCQVVLNNGDKLDNVYIAEVDSYFKVWGIMPEDDPGKRYISINDVKDVKESPNRLPAHLATKLYKAGESGMGYTIFTIIFKNGQRYSTYTGNAIDFIDLPNGLIIEDIIDVIPHEGRKNNPQPGPKYYWCLFKN
jgi:hypothetical protein